MSLVNFNQINNLVLYYPKYNNKNFIKTVLVTPKDLN
jgi:hypothetical protein